MIDENPFRLDGKVALVTGAGRGIGAAIALAMADAGADVGLVARTEDDLHAVAEQVRARQRRAVIVAEDLAASRDLRSVVDRIATDLGALDVLVSNAGGAPPAPFTETSAAQLDSAFHFNVATAFALVQAATPHLLQRAGASVIGVSSNLDHLAPRGHLVYGTVKAALSHLMRLLAADLAPRIRVNAVAPSIVDTQAVGAALTDDMRRRIVEATPLGRLAQPQDVAWTVVWLASAASSYITGEVIDIDGGAQGPTVPVAIPDLDGTPGPPAAARDRS